jgi:hypothetical protein
MEQEFSLRAEAALAGIACCACGLSIDRLIPTDRIKHVFDSPQSSVGLALSQLAAAREQLSAVDLTTLSRDDLLELAEALESDAWQRAAVGFALVGELEARGVAVELGCSSTAVVLSERLRIGGVKPPRECAWRRSWRRAAPCPENV